MDKEYRKLTGTTILFAGANIISKLLKILLVPLYTYYLTTSEFGTGETVTITVNLLYPVFLLGVSEAAIRFTMKDEHSPESIVTNCFAVLLTASLAGVLLFIPLAFMPLMRGYLGIMYIMTVAGAVEKLMMAEAKGLGKNTAFAISEIVSAATLISFNVIMLAVLKVGIAGYLWSIAAASAARILFLFFSLKLFRLIEAKALSADLIKSILKFSLPFMPATILWWIMDSSGRYIVMWFMGASAAGIYAIAFRLSAVVTGISVVFHQAWQLSAIRQHSIGGYEPFYKAAIRSYSTMFFFGASVIILFARPLMLLLDDSYDDAWRYAPLLLIAAAFFALSGFVCANYYVCEKTRGVLWTSFAGAAVSLAAGIFMTPRLGMQGTAAAELMGFYSMWLIMTIHTGRLLDFKPEYLMIHIDLIILLAEAYTVIRLENPLPAMVCPLLLLILNRSTVSGMIGALTQIRVNKE